MYNAHLLGRRGVYQIEHGDDSKLGYPDGAGLWWSSAVARILAVRMSDEGI